MLPRQKRNSPSSLLGLSLLAAAASTRRTPVIGALALSSTASSASTSSNVCNARRLGSSDLVVSETCLGTMTFGVQNDASDAYAQLDYALSRGCNFVDTAELYPVPLTAPEYRAGATEEILGGYIERIGRARRDELVVATKIAGYSPNSPVAAARSFPNAPIDPSPDCRLDTGSVKDAVHASLRRLRTDRIDLMQVHWPDRYVPAFGMTTYHHSLRRRDEDEVPILETASALKDLIDEGKVRYIGLSNESTYGVCEWIRACEQLGIRDRIATIQNSYSLLDRRFDSELAEACDHYNIGLLPWSVLAGGLLSGKYNKRVRASGLPSTSNSRFVRFPDYMQRWHPSSASQATLDATEQYAQIALDAGMTPSELAIAFVRSRKFVEKNGSVIVGATTMEQLEQNLAPFDHGAAVELDEKVLAKIDEVHMKCRDPCCSL
eukprot:CAMPEP_0172534980 /NCGR_PEP_ID=MMETSP1067-20121228/7171_1 /TAXON_ID=265564 ORGANISM="Thalassiosira punctigera, Strain Tpunct2005C2" /NCGR_SAMPLE_ID=MMETSP1067 /ASSEMBLY_ACC=CAM_ASM_000444 /LENGTH=434 /DNA_ID=CAMNT_0013319863 /DNA_START=8 /DNA_END=1312 /DNA_ORIENTATION=+